MPENISISSSLLKDDFAAYSILSWLFFFSLSALNISPHCLCLASFLLRSLLVVLLGESFVHVKLLFSCSFRESLWLWLLVWVSWLILLGFYWSVLDFYIHVSSSLGGVQPLFLQVISLPFSFFSFWKYIMSIFICLLMLHESLSLCSFFFILFFSLLRPNNLKWPVFNFAHSFLCLFESSVELLWWIFLFRYYIFQFQKFCFL